jgi:ABC-type Fe3+/spermidine/putrescine transport system ATPase subunit
VTHDQDEAMALSDRIALLRNGALEQIASPREIYSHPATAYTAQFIGQTNLLRAEVRGGTVTCGVLRWPTSAPDGTALFSLRPEAIRLTGGVTNGVANAAANSLAEVRFAGTVKQQLYGGASELLEINCGGQSLRVKIPARGPLSGEQNFGFFAGDAVPVSE